MKAFGAKTPLDPVSSLAAAFAALTWIPNKQPPPTSAPALRTNRRETADPVVSLGAGVRIFRPSCHQVEPELAACLIAARMRTYVPQRQMFPAMAAFMSASLGLGF